MTEQAEQNTAKKPRRYETFQAIYDICATGDETVLRTAEAVEFLETARHESLRIVWVDFLQPLRDHGVSLYDIFSSLAWALPDVFGEEADAGVRAIQAVADSIWLKRLRRDGTLPPEVPSDAA